MKRLLEIRSPASIGRCGVLALVVFLSGCGAGAQPEPRVLASWSFDGPEFVGKSGLRPRITSGVTSVEGVLGGAAHFASSNAVLVSPVGSPDRPPGIHPGAMCARFWFRPDWSSRGVGQGKGPGDWGCFLSLGERGSSSSGGWWEWSVSPDGTLIEFTASSGERTEYRVTSEPVAFDAGAWAEIVLDCFPGGLRAYKDGKVILTAAPSKPPAPSASVVQEGISIGARRDGTRGVGGALDELTILDAPLGRVAMEAMGRVMTAHAVPEAPNLRLEWRLPPNRPVTVQRMEGDTNHWSTLAQITHRLEFVDTDIGIGRPRTYRLLTNGTPAGLEITAGISLPPVEDRGEVALLIDETLAADLASSVDLLERDLVADGWRVFRREVPRHNDREWRPNTNGVVGIRSMLQKEWETSGRALRCVFLVGHVAIPYTGMRAEDTHSGRGDNHYGAWPGDDYYGDMDGIWTDLLHYPAYMPPTTFPITRNEHGDGKFDTEWVPPNRAGDTRLEAAFGRLDFAGMPAFGRGHRGEVDLLRQYLAKDHRYRVGEIAAEPRVVAAGYFGTGTDRSIFDNAYRTASRLYGPGDERIFEGDLFRLPQGLAVQWGFQSGPGAIDRIRSGSLGMVQSADLTRPSRQPRVLFAMFLGSWFGDWAAGDNNLLRAILASRDHGLATFWERGTEWRFDPLAWGGTLAEAQVLTANRVILHNSPTYGTTRTLTILGDPTLRLPAPAPPRNLRGRRRSDHVSLTWDRGSDAGAGYLVYRSAGGWRGPYNRLTHEPLQQPAFIDEAAPAGAWYLVRAARLTMTGSGSFTNLSPASFWPEPK